MKKCLMITIVVFAMAGCAVVDKSVVAGEHNLKTESINSVGELVSLINDYTEKINAVESIDDLFFVSERCYKDKMSIEKENAKDSTAMKNSFTAKEQAAYDEAIKNAMSKFEAAVNRKAKILLDEQEGIN